MRYTLENAQSTGGLNTQVRHSPPRQVCMTYKHRWEVKMVSKDPDEVSMRTEKVLFRSKRFRGMKTVVGKGGSFVEEAVQKLGRFLESELSELILPPGWIPNTHLTAHPGASSVPS